MAYTPYSQALPDTSRYTLDPVLQERLYPQVRPDPYQSGMLSTTANDYYADPFGYTNKRFGNLDEVLKKDTPNVGLGGMFAPPKPYENAGGSGDGPGGPTGPTGPGQGISNTGIDLGLSVLGITEGPLGYTTPGAIANLAAQAYLDNQIDALNEAANALSVNSTPDAFGLTGVAQSGMNTVSDPDGNVTTVSNDETIAAQNEAIFGVTDVSDPGGLGFDGSTAQAPSQSTTTSQAASGSGMGPDGSSGGGDSSGDSTHICTASYNVALITPTHFKSLKHYGVGLRKRDPYLMRAYDSFGPTLASYVGKSSVVDKAASFLTAYYKAVQTKDSLSVTQKVFSYASDYILRPAYRIIGWMLVNFVDKK